jgi:hypothetical protein
MISFKENTVHTMEELAKRNIGNPRKRCNDEGGTGDEPNP